MNFETISHQFLYDGKESKVEMDNEHWWERYSRAVVKTDRDLSTPTIWRS